MIFKKQAKVGIQQC